MDEFYIVKPDCHAAVRFVAMNNRTGEVKIISYGGHRHPTQSRIRSNAPRAPHRGDEHGARRSCCGRRSNDVEKTHDTFVAM
jgi:hypothetical protein